MIPDVSVIIPVFKTEQFIERCCRSLFAQTLGSIEYVFVDDCSPDGSIAVMRKVLEDYPDRKDQVRVIRMDRNSGQAAVREAGLREASGEYLIHCDSDDWVEPDMYRLLHERAVSEDADVVICDMFRSDGMSDSFFGCGFRGSKTYAEDVVAKRVFPALWNKLTRRSLFLSEGFVHPVCNLGEDYAITSQVAVHCGRVSYVDKPLYHYFTNPASITKDTNPDNVASKYLASISNIRLLESVLEREGLAGEYSRLIQAASLSDRFYILRDYIKNPEIMKLWKESMPELSWKCYLFNGEAQLKARVMSLLVDMGIYQHLV